MSRERDECRDVFSHAEGLVGTHCMTELQRHWGGTHDALLGLYLMLQQQLQPLIQRTVLVYSLARYVESRAAPSSSSEEVSQRVLRRSGRPGGALSPGGVPRSPGLSAATHASIGYFSEYSRTSEAIARGARGGQPVPRLLVLPALHRSHGRAGTISLRPSLSHTQSLRDHTQEMNATEGVYDIPPRFHHHYQGYAILHKVRHFPVKPAPSSGKQQKHAVPATGPWHILSHYDAQNLFLEMPFGLYRERFLLSRDSLTRDIDLKEKLLAEKMIKTMVSLTLTGGDIRTSAYYAQVWKEWQGRSWYERSPCFCMTWCS